MLRLSIAGLLFLGTACWAAPKQPALRPELELTNVKGIKFKVPDCDSYPCVIFEDNFNTFNQKIWEHEVTAGGGGNWEFQYYINNRSNSYVRDGALYIKPTLTAEAQGEAFLTSGRLDLWGSNGPRDVCTGNAFWGCERVGNGANIINPIRSARLRSVNSFAFKYGKIEVRAQLPKGDWIWPAIWMLPKRFEYGNWPASGEIDIMESRGNANLKDANGESIGHDSAGFTLHYGPFFPENGWAETHKTIHNDFGDRMHTFAVEWDENGMKWYVDGKLEKTINPGSGFWDLGGWGQSSYDNPWVNEDKMAPFNREFYIILNNAVGGTGGFFPDETTGTTKPWSNKSPTAMRDFWNARNQWLPTWKGEDTALKIDYVRVTKLKPDA